ncbi:hypothetical protein [Streptomyces dysideae]|uniref:Uncharacterized protein n=1 Tax=Streptomyces dysideae TaxID=909626 RepID=A0A117S2H8_9ACTN|nr:hypothetical protein [Streptomyces dysideae]KUO22459.1 hypothetical protein AQJ91_04110 [Streptomyces dysideae]
MGHGSLFELSTGPLLIPLPAILGVLLGRVVGSAFVAPPAAVALLAVTIVFVADSQSAAWLRGMAPVVFDEGARPLPSDLLGRAAGWHALYLLALSVPAAAGAVLASGGRTRAVRATALAALGAAVTAVVFQGMAPSGAVREAREVATRDPAVVQDCERRGATTYCAFPEFTPWIGEWARVTDKVRSPAGGPETTRALTVRQQVAALDGLSGPAELSPAAPGEATAALALAAAVVRFSAVQAPGPGVAGAVLALPVTAAVLLPPRFTLFVPPGDPRWADAHVLWCGVLATVLAAWAVCGPEPRRRSGA